MNRTLWRNSRHAVLDLIGQRILVIAVIGLPLWVNLWSQNTFEPAKAAILRLAAILLLVTTIACYPEVKLRLVSLPASVKVVIAIGLLWGSVYVVAAFVSVDPLRSILGSAYWRGGAITQLSGLLMFVGAIYCLRSLTAVSSLLGAVSLGSIPVALYALLQLFGLDWLSWDTSYPGRSFSTLGNPNVLAGYLAMILPVTISLMLIMPKGRSRYLLGGLVVVQVGALISTQSRGGILAFSAGLMVIALLVIRGSVLGKALFYIPAILLVVVAAFRPDPGATGIARLLMWKGTLQMISRRPWLGFGPEVFETIFPPFQPTELMAYGAANVTIDHAHNIWLDMAAESGMLGAITFLVFSLVLLIVGFRSALNCDVPAKRITLAGLLASLIAYLVQSQFMFQTVVPSAFFWILAGIMLALITMVNVNNGDWQVDRGRGYRVIADLWTQSRGLATRIRMSRLILLSALLSCSFLMVADNNAKAAPSDFVTKEFWGIQGGWAVSDNCEVLLTSDVAAAMRRVGAEAVRLNFRLGSFRNWTETDTCEGESALDLYDQVVDNLHDNELSVLGLLGHEAWHGTQAEWQANNFEIAGGTGDNDYLKEFSLQAAGLLMTHFHGRVNMWEIWNEPNSYTSFSEMQGYSGGSFIYPSNFAWLLRHVYLESRKAELAGVSLITGGVLGSDSLIGSHQTFDAITSQDASYVRPDYDDDPKGTETYKQTSEAVLTEYRRLLDSGSVYIRATYQQGQSLAGWNEIRKTFGSYPLDGIGQHLYVDQGSTLSTEKLRSYLQLVRDAYIAYEGQATSKQTFVTEVGWATNTVDDNTQALNLRLAYNEFWNDDFINSAFWFQFSDTPEASLYFGLIASSDAGDKKPAWYEYRNRSCCGSFSTSSPTQSHITRP